MANNFDDLIGCTLKDVTFTEDKELELDEIALDSINFYFDRKCINLKSLPETDEIEVNIESLDNKSESSYIAVSIFDSLAEQSLLPYWIHNLIDKKIQAIWLCKNNQGYQDQVIFAFDYLTPSISFVAEDSVLKVFQYQPVYKQSRKKNISENSVV